MSETERWLSFAREDLRAAEVLLREDAFYIPTRYPDALPGTLPGGLPGAADAKGTFEIAKEVLSIVGTLIESMPR